jgi:hypothetical protein
MWNLISSLRGDALWSTMAVICAVYGYSVALWPLFKCRGRIGVLVNSCAIVGLFVFPLAVPADAIGYRTVAVFLSFELAMKLTDAARTCRGNDPPRFGEFLRFLVPFPALHVNLRPRPVPNGADVHANQEVFRVVVGAAGFGAALLAVHLAAGFSIVQTSFVIDHALKLILFVVAMESLSQCLYGLERMAGYEMKPLIDAAYRSLTVGEFWSRYNTRVHEWLDQNIFRRTGGNRTPVDGLVMVFLVSAAFHEVAFDIATSRVDGYQFLFFFLQAPAVIVSSRIQRGTRHWGTVGRALSRLFTIAWFAISSILFFHGVNRVFPFVYASQPWLP